MMRHSVPLGLALLGGFLASGCASSPAGGGEEFAKPTRLLASVIQERIDQIPYQHREQLLQTLLWLKAKGELAIPALVKALDHKEPKVRSSAAWVLGMIGDKRAIPFLQEHRSETHPVARLEIARALLSLGDYSMVPVLIEGLEDEHPHVRYLCIEALRAATGKRFGYDHLTKDAKARREAVAQWKRWWDERSKDPFFGIPAAPAGR